MWEITTPRTIVVGEDALQYLKEIEGKRALIVTDKVVHRLGFVEKVLSYLKEAGMDVQIFDEVEPEPSVETVTKGVELAKEYRPDWLVALGGGSCIDTAKAMMVLYERPDVQIGEISPLTKLKLRKKTRLIAIPTTSGTGSEATWAVIITDAKEKRKMELASPEAVADICILDPELPLSMPPPLAADTGVDALTHAIESYISQWSNDFTEALAIKAIQIVFEYLPRAYRSREDKEAKAKMHFAATMAGLAFSNSQIGVAHAMGHAVGALFRVPHGRAVAVALPYAMEYSAREAMDKYATIAKAIGVESETDTQTMINLVEALKRLLREVNEPVSFREVGISWEEYEMKLNDLVHRAMESTGTVANPRVPGSDDYMKLFICAFNGERPHF